LADLVFKHSLPLESVQALAIRQVSTEAI